MCAGRKRTFEKEAALCQAMRVFWKKGYSGTSLSDLTKALGINKPSLYAAFGNKEALFVKTLEAYVSHHGVPHFEKLLAPERNLKDRIRDYLESIAAMSVDPQLPGGCFITTTTCETGNDCLPDTAENAVSATKEATLNALIRFFEKEQSDGNLSTEKSPAQYADFLLFMQFGLAVMARMGADQKRLTDLITLVLEPFPLD